MSSDTLETKPSKWNRAVRKTKKIFRWFLTLAIIFLGAFIYWKYFYTYSEGCRAGLL